MEPTFVGHGWVVGTQAESEDSAAPSPTKRPLPPVPGRTMVEETEGVRESPCGIVSPATVGRFSPEGPWNGDKPRGLPPTPQMHQTQAQDAPAVGDAYRDRVMGIADQLRDLQVRSQEVQKVDAEADAAKAFFVQRSSDMLAKLDTVLNSNACA